ncbi:hypothetical protein LTS08_007704 [Lithohypha guttulata]|nr:hypothetical protein LTS08_007704 [Lithohypha guttulata]
MAVLESLRERPHLRLDQISPHPHLVNTMQQGRKLPQGLRQTSARSHSTTYSPFQLQSDAKQTSLAHLQTVATQLRRPGKTIEYAGYELRDLNEVSTIKYYLATNAYLRVLCTNEAHTRDEDLLAATVIIRFYEELAALISGEPRDQLTRPFQLFVAAQARPDNFHFPPEQYNFQIPGVFASIRTIIEPYLETYQHGSFRIALRQECQRALLSRGKVHLPLEAWNFLEGFDETEDSVWTDRHLYHYARVLQYCFSHDEPESQKLSQYEALKGFETKWEETRPLSFSPYDQAQPDRDNGEIFPKYWYVNEVHAVGVMYLHLSRLLLTVYDPYIHRIGPGSAAAQRRVSAEVREVVIQICGVAMSSLNTQPVLVQALNTISMFGEHFTDRQEQEALLEVLQELENRHGWPVHRDAEALKREWGWTLDKDG